MACMISRRSMFAAALLFFGCLSASAVPLKFLAWDESVAARKLSVAYGKKSIDIGYMHPSARTDPLAVPADAENLRLVTRDRTDEKGRLLFVPLRIPAGVKKPLFLLMPDKKTKTGLRVLVFNDDPARFRWGTIRLLNFTGRPLVLRWGKKTVHLPNTTRPMTIAPGGKTRNVEVQLYLKDNSKRPLYSALWEYRADMRQIVFAVPNSDPALGPVAFKFISEHKDDAAANAAKPQRSQNR